MKSTSRLRLRNRFRYGRATPLAARWRGNRQGLGYASVVAHGEGSRSTQLLSNMGKNSDRRTQRVARKTRTLTFANLLKLGHCACAGCVHVDVRSGSSLREKLKVLNSKTSVLRFSHGLGGTRKPGLPRATFGSRPEATVGREHSVRLGAKLGKPHAVTQATA